MSSRFSLLVVLVLAIVAVGLWVGPCSSETDGLRSTIDSERNTAATAKTYAESDAVRGKTDQPGEREVARRSVDPDRTWIVRGEVSNTSEARLPSVELVARMFAGYEAHGEPLVEAKLRTNAAGRFEWPLDPPGRTVTLWFDVPSEDVYLWRPVERLVVNVEPAPQDIKIEAWLLDSRITGIVVDSDKQPIAGATAQIGTGDNSKMTTGADGRFDVRSPSWPRGRLIVFAPGYVVAYKDIGFHEPKSHVDLTIELRKGARIEGTVVDENRVPVEGAVITAGWFSYQKTESDVRGRFVVDWLDPSLDYQSVKADKEGFVQASHAIRGAPGKKPIELVLKRGCRLEGHVFDRNNQPIAGTRLMIERVAPVRTAVSHDDGSYAFETLPAQHVQLTARRSGYAMLRRGIDVPDGRSSLVHNIVLEPGHVLSGMVVDEVDAPIPGASVSIMIGLSVQASSAKSGPDGRFRVEDLPADEKLRAYVFCKGYVSDQVVSPVELGKEAKFVLQSGAYANGKVIDAETKAPVTSYMVLQIEAETREGEKPGWLGFSALGTDFDNEAGEWRSTYANRPGAVVGIRVTAEDYAPSYKRRIVVQPRASPDANIVELRRGGRITARSSTKLPGSPSWVLASSPRHRVRRSVRKRSRTASPSSRPRRTRTADSSSKTSRPARSRSSSNTPNVRPRSTGRSNSIPARP